MENKVMEPPKGRWNSLISEVTKAAAIAIAEKCQLTCGKFRLLHRISDKAGQQQKGQHEDNQCGITGSGQLISRSPFICDGDCKKIGHKKTSLCAQEGTKNRTDKNLSHVPPYAGIIRFK